jgi:anti-sigma regulatory factor (Ser/Thr protein kinase)
MVNRKLTLFVEELISNVIKYGDRGGKRLAIRLSVHWMVGTVRLLLEDDGHPFDPLSLPAPNLEGDLDSRPAGGLGIDLVQQISYRRHGTLNALELSTTSSPASP